MRTCSRSMARACAVSSPLHQFRMHIGETAVTHNEHMIARSGGGAHGADQRIYFIKGLGASGERRERRLQIPAERMAARCRAIPENQVGAFKTGGQLRLHHAQLHRIRARLKHGQNPRLCAHARAQGHDGGKNGARMMRKSSYTVTPSAMPYCSIRRLTPAKWAIERAPRAGITPACRAAASAASALSWLCTPDIGQSMSPACCFRQ